MSAVMARPVGEGQDVSRAVRIEAAPDGVEVSAEGATHPHAPPANAKIPLLYFPDGRRYAVEDTTALDTVLAEARVRRRLRAGRWARFLGWHTAALLALTLAVALTLAHRWSLPLLAQVLGSGVSSHALRGASNRALARLDGDWLAPSRLDDARQNALRARFASLRMPGGDPIAWRLMFRSGQRTGPAAFSLPDGDIVVTDELVSMAFNDEQILAVLAHEFGRLVRGDALNTLARERPALILRSWGGGDRYAADLARALIDHPPRTPDGTYDLSFAAEVLAANRLDSQALWLLDAMRNLPRPADVPALIKGY